MNILFLIASYRRNGNTDQVTGLMREHLQQVAALRGVPLEIETVYLGQLDLTFCRGCRVCFDRGEALCPVHDDLLSIKAKMEAADGVLFASPVYVDDVSGLAKTFIDRLCHLCHRPQFAGKVAYLVATSGSSPTGRTLGTLKLALRTWGFHIAGQSGYKMGALMKRDDTRAQFDVDAARAARRFFDAIDRRVYLRPGFYSLMVFNIQQRAWLKNGEPGSVDLRYWQEQGWLDPRRSFYIEHREGAWKVALARLAGAVISRFVT